MTQANTQLAKQPPAAELVERVLMAGDLAKLTAQDRLKYYSQVCESLGLNPLTQPFAYITLNGKLTLYARKDCTDQLRQIHQVSITVTSRETTESVYVVTAQAKLPNGRTDEEIGAVNIAALKGDALANAMMKASTKAKRRVTLSICGLGFLDETEVETIAPTHAQPAPVDDDRATPEQVAEITSLLEFVPAETQDKWFKKVGVSEWQDFPAETLAKCIEYARKLEKESTEQREPEPPAEQPATRQPPQDFTDLNEKCANPDTFTAMFTAEAFRQDWTEEQIAHALKKGLPPQKKTWKDSSVSSRVGMLTLLREGAMDWQTGKRRETANAA